MDGASIASSTTIGKVDRLVITGVEDFDGDSKDDILWRSYPEMWRYG